jgi:cytochrome c oxidase subunit II
MKQDMFAAAGPHAERILELWWLTFGICAFVFVAVLVAFVLAMRQGLTGTGIAARPYLPVVAALALSAVLLVVVMFLSFGTDRALATLGGEDPLKIEVTAHRWWWEARYQDPDPSRTFTTANELHIPVGRAVELTLKADDVIHSFWVPNLGGKRDLIPGRTATLRLQADKAGSYRGQCAEFCGVQHAKMGLVVYASEDYEKWAEAQRASAAAPKSDEEKRGRELFVSGTCAMCHTIQGTPANGRRAPDLTHLASRTTLGAGAVPNTRGHLAGWIIDPHSIKPGVNMPAHATLSASDLQALVAYLASLK